jgi:phosphoglycolate phosphatase-like HAD superfamily hydrolase
VSGRWLVLFDIDGTLLSTGGVSARALGTALLEVFRTEGPVDGFDYSGKTDPQIVRELMRAAGVAEEAIDAGAAEALRRYRARLQASLRPEHVRAKPGVPTLLETLAADPRVALGLVTGNLEPCARLKLEPLGLNGRFAFGAFGSDHEDRSRLPALAVERALAHTGWRFEGKSIVIVGDSVADVSCGRSLGVRAVAVATGRTPASALAAAGPDVLLPDLADTGRALDAIRGD